MIKMYFNAMLSDRKTCLPFEVVSLASDLETKELLVSARRLEVTIAKAAFGKKCPVVLYKPNESNSIKLFTITESNNLPQMFNTVNSRIYVECFATYELQDKTTQQNIVHFTEGVISSFPMIRTKLTDKFEENLW